MALGIGDEVMASGHAKTEFIRTGKRVWICDKSGKPRWSDLWHGLDWIAQPHEKGDFATVINGGGCRPYVKYPWHRGKQAFTDWRARDHIGGLLFTESEMGFALGIAARHPGFVVIEPNLKPGSNPNKQWGFERWQALVRLTPEIAWLQIGLKGSRRLDGVAFVETGTFRLAAAVLSKARFAVLPEGALHHAAGHMGKKAIVLFGGAIPPETLGYEWHDNIADHGPDGPCGEWKPCAHCARVWASIRPEMIAQRVREHLSEQAAA